MKKLRKIISIALVFTLMASFTVSTTKAQANITTDFITSDTDIDAMLKTPYVDAVPTAFSELILGIHTTGFGFAKDTLLRTGTTTNYDMQVGVKVNGNKIEAPEGYYYPSHTALSGSAQMEPDVIKNIAPNATVTATYSYDTNIPSFVTDGVINYANKPVNRWATWKSPNNADTLTFSFDGEQVIKNIDVHFFTDGSGTLFPTNVVIKYWNGTEYVEMPNITYPAIVNGGATAYTFDEVVTDKITITCTRAASNKGMGITEIEIFGKESDGASDYRNIARGAEVSSSIVPKYNSVQEINDGIIGFYSADNNRWNTYTGSGTTKVSTIDFELEASSTVDKIIVYPYDERAPYGTKDVMLAPQSVTFQYVKDGEWTDIPDVSAPASITPGTAATYTFPEIKTTHIRATVTAYDGKTTGITELEIYGKSEVNVSSGYSVEISEDKFVTTDHVVTSVVTVKNVSQDSAIVKFTTKNSRAAISEVKDGYSVVMSAEGATEVAGGFTKTVTLEAGQSTQYISTLSFAKTEAEAKANAKAVAEDTDRLNNHKASYLEWFSENIPFFVCDDPQITQTYYFRWLTYRNNIRLLSTDKYMISEFMPNVSWAGAYNSIVAPLSHHMNEGRWIKNGEYIDDYKDFWFETEGAKVTGYVNSTADAYYADYLVNGDKDALIKHLDNLISVYNVWETNTSSADAYYDANTGLYFVKNGYDGMEYSLSYKKGGTDVGYRPTVNAYMYGDAMAIAEIATLAGKIDLAKTYYDKAQKIKTAVETLMWNSDDKMFEAYDLGEAGTLGVKELIGYVPWYYNMPTDSAEFAAAWEHLTDENTFYAPYGPATADKSHADFNTYYTNTSLGRSGSCNWDGSSWPFATAQTLTAAANAINNYENSGVSASDFYTTLKAYTNGQYKNGYSWVGENLDGDTGKWYIDHATRSYHYNHSAYADLIITGLVGIRPADNNDTVVINPLVPENTLSSFVLENVQYRGNNITVVYDKNGDTYGVGKGLTVYVDGEVAATADEIGALNVRLATYQPKTPSLTCENNEVTLSGDNARRVYWGYIGTENTEYTWFNDFKAQAGDSFTAEYTPKADDEYTMTKEGYYRFVVNYIDGDKSVDLVFTFENETKIATPEITADGNYAVISDNATKLYYGYIGTEKTPYVSFDRSVLTEADFDVKTGDKFVMTKAGYYRFVVVYNLNGKVTEAVYTIKNEKEGGQPSLTHADSKITLSTGGVTVNKMYIAYNGEETVEVNNWADYCEKAVARACYLTPDEASEYTLKNTGCYTILVNYFDGNKNVDKYFTINN